MRIQFKNVGRNKETWTAEVKCLTAQELVRAIKKRKALMSSDIEVVDNEPGDSGVIIVGGFRRVGEWSVVKEDNEVAYSV